MRFAWITDPHLSRVPASLRERWMMSIGSQQCDALLISGDVGESLDVTRLLDELAGSLETPIYFVLGNHDFYGSSLGATVEKVIHACRENQRLHYLTDLSALPIGDTDGRAAFLVGEDGWGDAVEGDYENSYVRLNDFQHIDDFARANHRDWKSMLGDLGARSAERLRAKLLEIPASASEVLVVTHVPPFREACWYEGQTTNDDWAPFFVCAQVGRALREVAAARPECRYTVLCGHTHNAGTATMEPNLIVHTGGAVYGEPSIVGVIDTSQRPLEPTPPT